VGETVTRRIQCTRNMKRGKVQVVARTMSTGKGVTDHVGPREELTGTVVVIREIHAERLAGLQCQYAVESPPVDQFRPAPAVIGKEVAPHPDESLPYVEVRVAFLEIRTVTVVGLCSIGHEVLPVTGVVDGVGVGVIDRSFNSPPTAQAQLRLQGVVVRVGGAFKVVHVEESGARWGRW